MFRTLLPRELSLFSQAVGKYLPQFKRAIQRNAEDDRVSQFLSSIESEAEVFCGLTATAAQTHGPMYLLGPHLRPLLSLAIAAPTQVFLVGLHPDNAPYFEFLHSIGMQCQRIDPPYTQGQLTSSAAATLVFDPTDLDESLRVFIQQATAKILGNRVSLLVSGRNVHTQRKIRTLSSNGNHEVVVLPGGDNFMHLSLEVSTTGKFLDELCDTKGLFLERELGVLIRDDFIDGKLLAQAGSQLAIVDPSTSLETIPKIRTLFASGRFPVERVVRSLGQSSSLAEFFFERHPSRDMSVALRDFCLYVDRIAVDDRIETLKQGRSNGYSGIRPIIWSEQEFYDALYLSEGYAEQTTEEKAKPPFVYQQVGGVAFSHEARLQISARIVEYVIRIIHVQKPNAKIRWLDVGCGSGTTIHLALNSLKNTTGLRVEAIGVDSSAKAINAARAYDQPDASFICGNALELPSNVSGDSFDVVTMFEFLEHLPDPVAFIRSVSQLANGFAIGGSPLDEPLTGSQALAHLYSFSADGFASLFAAAGLSISMLNQTKIGSYNNGDHDWVTCVASRRGIKLTDRATGTS